MLLQCTIDMTGMCVSMATYDQYAKANGTLDDPDFLGYFPAANFTYCSISDEKCQSCKERWRQTYADTGRVPSGETCSGANGCLCVAVCEMPDRAEKILGRVCPAPFGLAGPRSKLLITMYLGMGLLAMLLIVIIIFKTWHRTRVENGESSGGFASSYVQLTEVWFVFLGAAARERARRELRERLRNRPLRTGPPLVLKGWSELREKLLESEREFIEGGGKLSEPGVKQLEDAERGGSDSERGESEIELVPRVV